PVMPESQPTFTSGEDYAPEIDEVYYILDRRGKFLSANKKIESFSEYTEDELMELTLGDIIPKEQETEFNQWLSSLDMGYSSNDFKTQFVTKYGRRKPVDIHLTPVRNRDNEISSYKGKFIFPDNHEDDSLPKEISFDQARMIREMVDLINSSYNDSLNHLLQKITKIVCQLFRFRRATLALLDRRRNVFVKQAMVGYLGNTNGDTRIMEVPQDIIERAFSEKYRIKVMYFDQNLRVSPDALSSGLYERRSQPRPKRDYWHPNDMIILNLVDKNEKSFGYISIDNPDFEHSPTREIFYNLELFASLASMAIENHYRFSTIEKRNRRLKQLLITSNIFKLHLNLTEMLNEVVWSIKFSLDFNLVMLGLISKKSGKLEIKALACDDRIKTIQLKELKFPVNEFKQLFKKKYKQAKSYFINSEEAVLRDFKEIYYNFNLREQGERFWQWYDLLLIPIRSKDHRIIGFLLVDDPADNLLPSHETIHTLEILATQVSVAIENRLIYLQLKEKAEQNTTRLPKYDIDSDRGLKKFMDKFFK
ncbi:PAS domain-containing protein, partial [candidate division KSB1 bacterium]|nr:PAS domain-containing protein [candidate division KSB1 bacterium]